MNPGKKSSKLNQDCTICHSCREAVIGPVVLNWRENRSKWRAFGGQLTLSFTGVPGATAWRSRALRRREAVRYETVFGVGLRDRQSRRRSVAGSVSAMMASAYWLIELHAGGRSVGSPGPRLLGRTTVAQVARPTLMADSASIPLDILRGSLT